jgi:hypothetical protein
MTESLLQSSVELDATLTGSRQVTFAGTDTAEAGFDSTHFGSAEAFKLLRDELSLSQEPARFRCGDSASDVLSFIWFNDDLLVITKVNPITGEAGGSLADDCSEGYASYIGIEGNAHAVTRAVSLIRIATECNPDAYTEQCNRVEREFI